MASQKRLAATVLVILVVAVGGAGCSRSESDSLDAVVVPAENSTTTLPASQSGSEGDLGRFTNLLSESQGDNTVYPSLPALLSDVDVVVRGKLKNVRTGRSFFSNDEDYPAFRTVVADIEISEVLGGNQIDLVKGQSPVIEFLGPMNQATIDDVAKAAPVDGEVIIAGDDYSSPQVDRIEGTETGRVYIAPYAQGFVMQDSSGLVSVLGGLLPADIKTLDALEDQIRAAEQDGLKR